MNKQITIYELLGLIKDGKAPKKIKWKYTTYYYTYKNTIKGDCAYLNDDGDDLLSQMIDCMYLSSILDEEVEIIEEDKPIIEKLYIGKNDITYDDGAIDDDELVDNFIDVKDKLNEVIDYINKKEG